MNHDDDINVVLGYMKLIIHCTKKHITSHY